MDIKNYLEQHQALITEITTIKSLMSANDVQQHAGDIALHISTLAGKIKIHLSMEDKYLYPGLQESEDKHVRKIADDYQKEMGDLAEKFVNYKDKYNTKPKILQNLEIIKQETTQIFQAIEKRVEREEKELYKFL